MVPVAMRGASEHDMLKRVDLLLSQDEKCGWRLEAVTRQRAMARRFLDGGVSARALWDWSALPESELARQWTRGFLATCRCGSFGEAEDSDDVRAELVRHVALWVIAQRSGGAEIRVESAVMLLEGDRHAVQLVAERPRGSTASLWVCLQPGDTGFLQIFFASLRPCLESLHG